MDLTGSRQGEDEDTVRFREEEQDMLNIIRNAIREYVDVEEDRITEETNPVTDLSMTSYDFISVVGKLENELGVEIPEREMRKFETLGDLDRYIRSRMQP
jgi:acyl carrier protein